MSDMENKTAKASKKPEGNDKNNQEPDSKKLVFG